MIPYRPRWLNQVYAQVFGYFWLPCPICGEFWGGHEWRAPWQEITCCRSESRCHGICTRCAKAGLSGGRASQAYCVRRGCRPEARRAE